MSLKTLFTLFTQYLIPHEFTNFMEKILKISEWLNDQPIHSPLSHDSVASLDYVKELTYDEVKKIICSMTTKSCEIDCLPTKFIKDCLHDILPVKKP